MKDPFFLFKILTVNKRFILLSVYGIIFARLDSTIDAENQYISSLCILLKATVAEEYATMHHKRGDKGVTSKKSDRGRERTKG